LTGNGLKIFKSVQYLYLTARRWIAVGFLLGVLTACQSDKPIPSTQQVTLQPSPETTPARPATTPRPSLATVTPLATGVTSAGQNESIDLEGTTFEFWFTVSDAVQPALLGLIDEFNRENLWGVRVVGVPFESYGVMEERYRQARLERVLPGLIAGYTEQVLYWDAGGFSLRDVSDYIENPTWGLTQEDVSDFIPAIWKREELSWKTLGSKTGVRVGLPWHRIGTVILYNQTWAEEFGFRASPSTPEDFQRQACQAATANLEDDERENDGSGGWLVSMDSSTLLSWIFAFGGQVDRQDGQGYRFDSPEARNALQFIHDLRGKGCAWITEEPLPFQAFSERKALFVTVSLAELPAAHEFLVESGFQDTWIVLPFPSPDGPAAIDLYGPTLVLMRASSKAELAAWLFARWLTSSEIQVEWSLRTGYFPSRSSALMRLESNQKLLPQQQQAMRLLHLSQPEPAFASWSQVRWALGDALMQLLSTNFQREQIEDLLENLNLLAAELFRQYR